MVQGPRGRRAGGDASARTGGTRAGTLFNPTASMPATSCRLRAILHQTLLMGAAMLGGVTFERAAYRPTCASLGMGDP